MKSRSGRPSARREWEGWPETPDWWLERRLDDQRQTEGQQKPVETVELMEP
ncbi:hypothetical protein [Azospirillum sp. B506]|uniref:hypothetical protein n=1 Tax=Azospirillum sp. B506 TaxID=137721 RepID=UPI00034CB418|nr:hypothetical protein [Azospirillum sp. B506]